VSPRILVVDDEGEIVRLVRTCLEENNYEVLVAYDGKTALQMLRRERPDLVLLDLMPPKDNRRDVACMVRGNVRLAAMPVMKLTAQVEDREDNGALPSVSQVAASGRPFIPAARASDDGTRPFDPQELLTRVRAVLQVQAEPSPPKVIRIQALTVDLDARRAEAGGQTVHLTPTEFALLRALAEQPGQTMTRQEMIQNGPGPRYEGSERTVDSHIKNLRRKLDEAGEAAHLVETVFGIGYRLAAGDRA
jgi:two-component system alkaline phosphatase synthesis response regulator PhoP